MSLTPRLMNSVQDRDSPLVSRRNLSTQSSRACSSSEAGIDPAINPLRPRSPAARRFGPLRKPFLSDAHGLRRYHRARHSPAGMPSLRSQEGLVRQQPKNFRGRQGLAGGFAKRGWSPDLLAVCGILQSRRATRRRSRPPRARGASRLPRCPPSRRRRDPSRSDPRLTSHSPLDGAGFENSWP